MVKLFLLLISFCWIGQGDAAQISVRMNEARLSPGRPMQGVITVIHDDSERVDINSFTFDRDPLVVVRVGESRRSSISIRNGVRIIENSVTSSYRFEAAQAGSGIQSIPKITVMVAGERIETVSETIKVEEARRSSLLELRPLADFQNVIYPGQRVRLGYQIHSRDQIDLTELQLPLLELKGFDAIGDRGSRSYRQGTSSVAEVSQEFQAISPGDYEVGPSVVEGYRFQQGWFGRKSYEKPRLRAEMEGLTLRVRPLPQPSPAGFYGALGEFKIEAILSSGRVISVGDKIKLAVTISGEGEWYSVKAPDLKFQEGFSRDFRLSDLPPEERRELGKVTFLYELRPLSERLAEIPALTFTAFSPKRGEYVQVRSAGIPISVAEGGKVVDSAIDKLEDSSTKQESAENERVEGIALHPPIQVSRTTGYKLNLSAIFGVVGL
jgi:hypothetical protein